VVAKTGPRKVAKYGDRFKATAVKLSKLPGVRVQEVAASAFVVRVPEAEVSVHGLRQRCDPSASVGMPAHITVLFPFMPPERITSAVLRKAETAIRKFRPFSFALGEIRRWPETTYLLPKPATPFIQLTDALVTVFPDYPPYSGKYSGVVPHLTVADRNALLADEAERELRAILNERGPITSQGRTVELLENSSGIWRLMHAITLEHSDG
jgi:transposase-like protein